MNDRKYFFTVSHAFYKVKTLIYSNGAISERVVDNLVFFYTYICNKVTRLSASPHQTLDMMI